LAHLKLFKGNKRGIFFEISIINHRRKFMDKYEEHHHMMPHWLVNTLGVLLVIFVAILIVQKGNEVKTTLRNQKPANTISVSADGKVQAVPDLATVNLGVLSQGSSAKDVKDRNNEKINAIIDYVKSAGVDSKDIVTSQFYAYPQYNYSNGQSNITGYQANQTITIKIHGIDKSQSTLEKIVDEAVNRGANEIQGVSFTFEDADNLRQEARKMAIAKAKEKAAELAAEAGLSLGKVVSISEAGTNYPGPIPYATDSFGRGGAVAPEKSVAPNIEPGSQDITETMTVVFEVK